MYRPKDIFENPTDYIDFLLSKDFESQWFDHKEIVNPYNKDKAKDAKEKIQKCISAFANYNQEGGLIVLGINDKTKEVIGVDHLTEEQLNTFIKDCIDGLTNHHTKPKLVHINQKAVYLFYTQYSENAICETLGGNPQSWKRVGKQCLTLTETDKQQILRDKRVVNWENMILDVEFHEKDLDSRYAQNFKSGYLEYAEDDMSMTTILNNIGAIREQNGKLYWTNAGLLFFDQSPQRVFPQAAVRFVRYDYLLADNPHLSLTSFDESFSYASLPALLQKIRTFIQRSAFLRTFTVRNAEGHLQDFGQFPYEAIEEGIVNAMVHRDYALTTTIWCKLYLDAFVVENAGRILQPDRQVPESFSLENYELTPNPRNPRLVEWIKKLRNIEGKPFVKGISEGTRKMRKLMQEMYFPYPSYQTNGLTKMTLQSVATPEEFEESTRKRRFKL